jgi:hypothetical protein
MRKVYIRYDVRLGNYVFCTKSVRKIQLDHCVKCPMYKGKVKGNQHVKCEFEG